MNFGMLHTTFPDGSYVRLEDGQELDTRRTRREMADGTRPELVLVRLLLAAGSGLLILHRDTDYFLPAPVTRGAHGATEEDLAAAPVWAAAAYQWWLDK